MHSFKFWLNFSKVTLLGLVFLLSPSVQAVVNIDRTRVIIPTGKTNTSFNLVNQAIDKPALVQIWIDEGDPTIAPEKIKSPVVVLDPIFKLEANEKRNIKLVLPDSSKIAADKESVYWLNVLQIPAQPKAQTDQQRILLPLRLRLKLFIRPAQVAEPTETELQQLRVTQQGTKLIIHNPTPWNITLIGVHIGEQKFNDFMVMAKSQYSLERPSMAHPDDVIEFNIVNDLGHPWPMKFKVNQNPTANHQ